MKSNRVYLCIGILGLLVFLGLSIPGHISLQEGQSTKASKLGFKHDHSQHTEKLEAPIYVSLKNVSDSEKLAAHEQMTLVGEVKSGLGLKNVKIKWAVPPGVEVVSGQTEYILADLDPKIPHKSEITITAADEANYQIYFIAGNDGEKVSFSRSAQYNTQNEEIIKRAADKLKAKHESYVQQKGKAPRF